MHIRDVKVVPPAEKDEPGLDAEPADSSPP